jgi:hypothetical protein
MNLLFAFVLLAVLVATLAEDRDFACNDYNNDCLSCIQFAKRLAFQCNFCPVDGVCHTVGSLFNKCSNDQCVSLSSGSKCKKKTAADCQNVKYGDEGFAQ